MDCQCVVKHLPLPLDGFRILVEGKEIGLCPTSYFNLQLLLTEFKASARIPEGHIRKHYSSYVQDLALRLWREVGHDFPKLFN